MAAIAVHPAGKCDLLPAMPGTQFATLVSLEHDYPSLVARLGGMIHLAWKKVKPPDESPAAVANKGEN